jgi:hypothetical protein
LTSQAAQNHFFWANPDFNIGSCYANLRVMVLACSRRSNQPYSLHVSSTLSPLSSFVNVFVYHCATSRLREAFRRFWEGAFALIGDWRLRSLLFEPTIKCDSRRVLVRSDVQSEPIRRAQPPPSRSHWQKRTGRFPARTIGTRFWMHAIQAILWRARVENFNVECRATRC